MKTDQELIERSAQISKSISTFGLTDDGKESKLTNPKVYLTNSPPTVQSSFNLKHFQASARNEPLYNHVFKERDRD